VVGNAVLGQTKGSFDDPGSGGGLTRCGLRVRPDHVIPAITAPAGGKNAAATAMVKIGRDPLLAGHRFYAQWILPKMRGASSTTRVLEITIQAELPPPYVP
jgi:hypothetical protein